MDAVLQQLIREFLRREKISALNGVFKGGFWWCATLSRGSGEPHYKRSARSGSRGTHCRSESSPSQVPARLALAEQVLYSHHIMGKWPMNG
jgi:hypothetical protein